MENRIKTYLLVDQGVLSLEKRLFFNQIEADLIDLFKKNKKKITLSGVRKLIRSHDINSISHDMHALLLKSDECQQEQL